MVCVCGHKKDKHESAGSRKELLFGFRTLCREVGCICESYKQKWSDTFVKKSRDKDQLQFR